MEIHCRLVAIYGENVMLEHIIHKWCQNGSKLNGNQSMMNPMLGSPLNCKLMRTDIELKS